MRRFFIGLLLAVALLADSGKVLLRKPAGPFQITLFGSPGTIRVGKADLSVLVQKASDESVPDADVKIHLTRSAAGEIRGITVNATHAQATNKLLYAAAVDFPSTGSWQVDVEVREGAQSAEISGRLEVQPPQPPIFAYWPYLAVVPLLILLFAVNQWLKRRRGAPYRPART